MVIICAGCRRLAFVRSRGQSTARFCSRSCSARTHWQNAAYRETVTPRRYPQIVRRCHWCQKTFQFRALGPKADQKRRFCGTACAATWRMDQPGRRDLQREVIKIAHRKARGVPRPDTAARMRRNNPVNRPGVREKISASKKGQTFLARGGNGKPTPPQLALAAELNWPIEVAISTTPIRAQFKSLPPAYKVDVGDVETRTAVEVDGKTHRTRKWRFLDRRKTEVLAALGWTVVRFWNEEVLTSLPEVVAKIRTAMTLKSMKTTPTSPTEC